MNEEDEKAAREMLRTAIFAICISIGMALLFIWAGILR
jgi:hypothetical protein